MQLFSIWSLIPWYRTATMSCLFHNYVAKLLWEHIVFPPVFCCHFLKFVFFPESLTTAQVLDVRGCRLVWMVPWANSLLLNTHDIERSRSQHQVLLNTEILFNLRQFGYVAKVCTLHLWTLMYIGIANTSSL